MRTSELGSFYFKYSRAVDTIGYVGDAIPPHANTVRSQFTVPTGTSLILRAAYIQIIRNTFANPTGMVKVRLSLGGTHNMRLTVLTNTEGDGREISVSPNHLVYDGYTINVQTEDASTLGSIDYNIVVYYEVLGIPVPYWSL